jgi:hypothetical protein
LDVTGIRHLNYCHLLDNAKAITTDQSPITRLPKRACKAGGKYFASCFFSPGSIGGATRVAVLVGDETTAAVFPARDVMSLSNRICNKSFRGWVYFFHIFESLPGVQRMALDEQADKRY